MNEIIHYLNAASGGAGVPDALLAIIVKSGVLLVLALLAGLLLHRAPASLRHLCWTVALGAVLVLPLCTMLLPSWRIAVLPAREATQHDRHLVGATAIPQTALGPGPISGSGMEAPAMPDRRAASNHAIESPTEVDPAVYEGHAITPPGTTSPDAVAARTNATTTPSLLPAVLLWIWVVGAGGVLVYMAIGSVAAARIAARSRQVHERGWIDALDEVVDRLAIRRPVQLLMSADVRVPMVWGVLRPAVMLPESAQEWDDERRRCVLTHELAHVRRWDGFTQLLAGVACALHWMNPLVWVAVRRMRLERELACDDYVLRSARTRASSYASHLLEIARQAPRSIVVPTAAVAMARRSQLEGRVLSILEEGGRRTSSRSATATVLGGAALVLLLVAAFQPVSRASLTSVSGVASAQAFLEENADGIDDDVHQQAMAEPEAESSDVAALHPAPPPADASVRAGDVLEQVFSVSPGGSLHIDSDHGSIDVRTDDVNQVRLQIRRTTRGGASPDDFVVSSEQSGNEITIEGTVRSANNERDGVEVAYLVLVPRQFNLYLETGGGSVAIEGLQGEAQVETGGGSLNFSRLRGALVAETSGGSIALDGLEGDAVVETSGGSISVHRVSGTLLAETSGGSIDVIGGNGKIIVETSGGNIRMRDIVGNARAETSGGDIRIESLAGSIFAETSGGSIMARLDQQPSGDSYLEASGGGVTVYLSEAAKLNLEAHTNGGTIETEIEIESRSRSNDHLKGTMNGGGPRLVLEGRAVRIRRQ